MASPRSLQPTDTRTAFTQPPSEIPHALECLHDAGGHFVLLRDKRAFWRAWPRRRPSLDTAIRHWDQHGDLGLIPWSVGCTVIDVDSGPYAGLALAHPPLTILPTRRGAHLPYEDSEPRRNANGRIVHGCKVDVRGARGYVRFHGDGPLRLADALDTANQASRFPADLFEASGLQPYTGAPLAPRQGGGGPLMAKAAAPRPSPSEGRVGSRHPLMFNMVRFWAYRENRGSDLEAWIDRVEVQAFEFDLQMPEPYATTGESDRVRKLAYAVATWTWSGHNHRLHRLPTSETQRRRVVKRWYGDATQDTLLQLDKRDAAIVQEARQGADVRGLGDRHNLTPRRVLQILDQAGVKAHRNSRRDAEIRAMLAKGVSQAEVGRIFGLSRRQVIRIAAKEEGGGVTLTELPI